MGALPGADRASLIIDRRDAVVYGLDAHIRAAWGTDAIHYR